MAETLTLQQRMAQLNLAQVGAKPRPPAPPAAARKPAPPLPPRLPPRSNSTQNERVIQGEEGHIAPTGNQPAAAPKEGPQIAEKKLHPVLARAYSRGDQPSPAATSATPRRASELSVRRQASQESVASTVSTTSALSIPSTQTSRTTASRSPSFDQRSAGRMRAPEYDPNILPKLPERKSEPETPKRPSLHSGSSSRNIPPRVPDRTEAITPTPQRPALPSRNTQSGPIVQQNASETRQLPAPMAHSRQPSMPQRPKRSALDFCMNTKTETPPAIPHRYSISSDPTSPPPDDAPPPVPTGSKPSAAQLASSKPRPPAPAGSTSHRSTASTVSCSSTPTSTCLHCRDFSAPDTHAARFPRESIPSTDITWLAHQLTSPFPSSTDKARTIFTWLHHNIAYNVQDFFSGHLKSSTPTSTITTGLAVCEGYAGLFAALALASGLECVVVSGHGKGFGHTDLKPGEVPPPFSTGHAWNAVRIDAGQWKLLDACWGAGHISGQTQEYTRHFSPQMFTLSNAEFGLRHFPKDQRFFFLPEGVQCPSWEEYYVGPEGPGEGVMICGFAAEGGLSSSSFRPAKKAIRVSGQPATKRIQFTFRTVCPHWIPSVHGPGKPYPMTLNIGGKDGRKREVIVMDCDGEGRCWWTDVGVGELGCPGQNVVVNAITTLNGRDARGVGVEEMRRAVGRCGWSACSVAVWQLV